MGRYVLKRILLLIPVILVVIILVYTLMYLAPGDAAAMQLGADFTEEAYQELRHSLGLDRPFIIQIGEYMYNLFFKLDFGVSWATGASVADQLMIRVPRTLKLGIFSIIISSVVGILLGVNAAVHQSTWRDYGSTVLALIGGSMPGFFVALVLVILFAYKLKLLPAFGMSTWKHWILPVFSTAVTSMAVLTRQTRSSMLEVINSDYVIMAKGKGCTKRSVIYRHALPNALIPVITVIGTNFGNIMGGGLIIETVFSIPGVGFYIVEGCNARDYNVVLACTIVISAFFSVVMLLVDLVMAAVDPRIKSQFAARKKRKA